MHLHHLAQLVLVILCMWIQKARMNAKMDVKRYHREYWCHWGLASHTEATKPVQSATVTRSSLLARTVHLFSGKALKTKDECKTAQRNEWNQQ